MTSENSNTAPARIGLSPKLIRFAMTIVIATVFGPLIAGVTIFLMFAAMLVAQADFRIAGMGESFILMITATYLVGWVIALAAGTIVALAGLRRQPSFAVVIAAIVIANLGYFAVTETQLFNFTGGSTKPLQGLIVSLVFSAYAANVCWLLFRRFVQSP